MLVSVSVSLSPPEMLSVGERGARGGIVIDLRAVGADDAHEVARRAVGAGDEDRAAALGDGLAGRVFRRYGRCGLGIHGDAAEGRW